MRSCFVALLLLLPAPCLGVSNGFTFECNPNGNFGCNMWRRPNDVGSGGYKGATLTIREEEEIVGAMDPVAAQFFLLGHRMFCAEPAADKGIMFWVSERSQPHREGVEFQTVAAIVVAGRAPSTQRGVHVASGTGRSGQRRHSLCAR